VDYDKDSGVYLGGSGITDYNHVGTGGEYLKIILDKEYQVNQLRIFGMNPSGGGTPREITIYGQGLVDTRIVNIWSGQVPWGGNSQWTTIPFGETFEKQTFWVQVNRIHGGVDEPTYPATNTEIRELVLEHV
jgi:hypothetical protein